MQRVSAGMIGVAALAWAAGAAWQMSQPQCWPLAASVAATVAAVVFLAVLWRWRGAGGGGWRCGVVLALAVLACASTDWRASLRLGQRLAPQLEGVELIVTGRVAGLPQPGPQGVRFNLMVDSAELAESAESADPARRQPAVAVPERIALTWRGDEAASLAPAAAPPPVRAGERWRLPVRLQRPHGVLNPGGFDAELWLFEQRIGATGLVRSGGGAGLRPQRLAGPRWAVPLEVLSAWRQDWRDAVLLTVPAARQAAVLAALTVGDQAAIGEADWALFRTTGVAHLMSISGLHITMLSWLAAAVAGAAWRRWPRAMLWLPAPAAARWGGLGFAVVYALLAGWGIPAQRTVGMLAVAVALPSLGWRWPPWLIGVAAGWAVVLADPWALLQPGFWLSFVAVLLLMLSDAQRGAPPPPPASPPLCFWRAIWQAIWQAIRRGAHTQWVATLGLAPLTLLFFQQVSLAGLLANAVAVPVVTLLIVPLALLGLLAAPLLHLSAALLVPLLAWLDILNALPLASAWAPAAPWWAAVLALAGAVVLVAPLPWRLRALGGLLCAPLLFPAVPRPAPGHFETMAVDVGQGSAVLVRTAQHLLLFDAGPRWGGDGDAGQRILLPLLRARGERRIDELVLSHGDADHVGGAAALARQMPVARGRGAALPDDPPAGVDLPFWQSCRAGDAWQWDGVHFEVLHPLAEAAAYDAGANATSCVLRVVAASGHALLLTGDIEAAQEAALVQRWGGQDLRADVLIVPHHGSRSSSSAALLTAVRPRVAVIQVGYRSRFGHPHRDVLRRYAAQGITVVRSDDCGAWTWQTWDDAGMWCMRHMRRRYWHTGYTDHSEAQGQGGVPLAPP